MNTKRVWSIAATATVLCTAALITFTVIVILSLPIKAAEVGPDSSRVHSGVIRIGAPMPSKARPPRIQIKIWA